MKLGNRTLEIPLIQGGMGVGVSLGNLAGSVMNQGAMGVISCAQPGYRKENFYKDNLNVNIEALFEEVELARSLSNNKGLLGVNIMVAGRQYESIVKAACEAKVDAIISGAGLPLDLPKYVTKDILIAPIVSSQKALELILKVWTKRYDRVPDFIVVEGPLAGGHLGFKLDELKSNSTQSLEEIVFEVKETLNQQNLDIPIFGAGGIMTHQDVLKVQAAGADGVQVATRFIVTKECDAHENFKQAILNINPEDIAFIKSPSGYPGRGALTPFTQEFMLRDENIKINRCVACLKSCNPQSTIYCITQALIDSVSGNVDEGVLFCGARAHELKEMSTVKEVIEDLMGKTAVVFNGQGSQTINMGSDFIDEYESEYPEIIDLIKNKSIEELSKTQNSQKSILLTSIAIYNHVKKHIQPDYVLGLSLGEYSALVASNVLNLEDAIEIVTKRGQLMQASLEKIDSKMVAVLSGDQELIENITQNTETFIANYNSPNQIVISGLTENIEKAKEQLTSHKIRTLDLNVSGAFHSPYLEEASQKLNHVLENYEFKEQQIPIIFNTLATPSDNSIKDLLTKQIKSPVFFQQSIEYLIKQGVTRFIEIGPGKTVSSFIKKINKDVKVITINTKEDLKEII